MHLRWWVGLIVLAGCGGNAELDGGGGSGGQKPATCDQLDKAYAQTLEDARICDVDVDEPECTTLVFTELSCPCEEIFVNALNDDALKTLEAIRDQYESQRCGPASCPAIGCLMPTQGSCMPDGSGTSSGLCQSGS